MANIKSQIKRNNRSQRERFENRHYTSQIKTYFRRLETAVTEGNDEHVAKEHRTLISLIDKAERYVWLGSVRERRVKLAGFVPNESARRDILGMAKATFPGGTDGDGIAGLKTYIRDHRQQDFVDNLCHKLLAYALGRTLLPSDERLIRDMRAKLEKSEYRFSVLVESIVTSPQFLNQRGDAAPK